MSTPIQWITVGCSTNGTTWRYPTQTTITAVGTVIVWALSAGSQASGWQLTNVFFSTSGTTWPGLSPGAVVLPVSGRQYGFVVADADSEEATYNYQFKIRTSVDTYTSPDPQIVNDPPTPVLQRQIQKG